MKELVKLSINPERILKNEELINLQGGDYEGTCGWKAPPGSPYGDACGYSYYVVTYWFELYGGNWCCDTPTNYCDLCGT